MCLIDIYLSVWPLQNLQKITSLGLHALPSYITQQMENHCKNENMHTQMWNIVSKDQTSHNKLKEITGNCLWVQQPHTSASGLRHFSPCLPQIHCVWFLLSVQCTSPAHTIIHQRNFQTISPHKIIYTLCGGWVKYMIINEIRLILRLRRRCKGATWVYTVKAIGHIHQMW